MIRATTELDAVNVMLATIGESPLSTIAGDLHADASMASQTLTQINKEVQSEGWFFNTEDGFVLTPDVSGHITLPEDIVSVDVSPRNSRGGIDIVQRGTRLYDRAAHSYTFKEPITATIIQVLPFGDIPEAARSYIAIVAARKFQTQVVGSESLHNFTAQDEFRARARLMREQIRNSDSNFLAPGRKTTFGMTSIARVTDRRI